MSDSTTSDRDQPAQPGDAGRREEHEIRRYEARMKLWTVVLGTMVVGLAGVLVPAGINYANLLFEREKAYQSYISSFLEKGIAQDIELRLRFAGYFAKLSADAQQKARWETYERILTEQRGKTRSEIERLESELARLCLGEGGKFDAVAIERVRRTLNWSYAEVGYAEPNRSVVTFDVVERRKRDLYSETRSVVQKLASPDGAALSRVGADYRRFWVLYREDLIGIESQLVATRMVELGRRLEHLLDNPASSPSDFRKAANEVVDQIDREMVDKSAVAPASCSAHIDSSNPKPLPAQP